MTNSQKNLLIQSTIITVLILTAFGNSLNRGFVWDDSQIIVQNQLLENILNTPKFFWMEDIADGPTGYYRPITYVSFALDRAIWGLNPVGFNITNLVLHILVALLFHQVVLTLFKKDNLALVAALVFALHPVVGETVNFHAGGRNTLLSACFSLGSLLFYTHRKQLPAVICFTLAIFSKEFALLLPAVFFLYDLKISREKFRCKKYLPYFIATICYLTLRSFVVQSGNLFDSLNITENFWIVPQTIIGYIRIMAFPVDLKTMYDVNNQITWSSFIFNSLALATLVVIAIVFRKRLEILFSIIIFLLFLLPVTNLLPLGSAMMADRFAYFSLFGFSLCLAYVICLTRRAVAGILLIGLCFLFMVVNMQRNNYWKNDVSLFSRMIIDAPEMSIGYINLGYAHYALKNYGEAEEYLDASLEKKDLTVKNVLWHALVLLEMEKPEKAMIPLKRGIEIDPKNPLPYVMATRICEQTGKPALAKTYRDETVRLFPGFFETMPERAKTAHKRGEEQLAKNNIMMAERFFYGALTYDPFFAPALSSLGKLAAERGDRAKAHYYLAKAAALVPFDPAAEHNISSSYEEKDKEAEARKQ